MAVKTNIKDVIPQLADVCSAVSGIKFASDGPVATVHQNPFAIVYLESGRAEMAPPGAVTYRDNIVMHCGVPSRDFQRDDEVILPIGRDLMDAVFDGLKDGDIEPLNFDGMEYDYGPFPWGGVQMFGLSIRILNVKTQVVL